VFGASVTAVGRADTRQVLAAKVRLLVDGISIDESFYVPAQGYKGRVEAIYGHHIGAPPTQVIPQELILHRPGGLGPTEAHVVQVRFNADSPHLLSWHDGSPVLIVDGTPWPVELIPAPNFYDLEVEPGTNVRSITQLLGTSLLGVVPSNYCALFSTKEECSFCEIIPHYSLAREFKRSIKPDDIQIKAINQALATDPLEYMVFTTGNYDLPNMLTVDHYVNVRSKLKVPDTVRRSYACLMPPDDVNALHRLKEAGFTSVILDIEIWNPDHYEAMVPGKAHWLGREGFLRMLDASIGVFGSGEVYSNLVYGIQSLCGVPDGSRFNGRDETDMCLTATDGLLARGVVPLFTVYHTAGHSKIGKVELDPAELTRFAEEYGSRVFHSKVIRDDRNAAIFGLGSIANHFYNDAYYMAKTSNAASAAKTTEAGR